MQKDSFYLMVVLGSILYILSSFLVQSVSLVRQAVFKKRQAVVWFEKRRVERHAEAAV